LLNHHHEGLGLREDFANGRRGMGIRRLCIAAAKSLLLRSDDALRSRDVISGKCGGGEIEQKGEKQGDGAHQWLPDGYRSLELA
jgi:hypothetical protein